MSEAGRRRSEERHRQEPGRREPAAFLVSLGSVLTRAGRALDVARGGGRKAPGLARRGLEARLVDIAATALARDAGLALHTLQADLAPETLPPGPRTASGACGSYMLWWCDSHFLGIMQAPRGRWLRYASSTL